MQSTMSTAVSAQLTMLGAALVACIYMSIHANAEWPSVQPLAPAMFILGDSLVDPGNNNYILTLAKSNFPPNGIDFGSRGATGRFCNGRTVADVISELMGLPFLPAYLDPQTQGLKILQGINYASAAGGILDSSGANYVGRISLNQQIQYFQHTQEQFRFLLGPNAANSVFAKSLYYYVFGSNDYINNYLLANSQTSQQYTPLEYQNFLVATFRNQLKTMYNLGARKMAIFNVGPLGCIPSQLSKQNSPDGRCIEFINTYVLGFNNAVKQMLPELQNELPGSLFLYADSYSLVLDKVNNPALSGLTTVNRGCCGVGTYNGQLACLPTLVPCADRTKYLFWDPFHPTDVVNVMLGQQFYDGPPSVISPMNIKQLAALS